MTGSAALDILIGLFTLYFVMSTLSSAIVEIISNLLALRANLLRDFLKFQFNRDAEKHTIFTVKQFYALANAKMSRRDKADPNKKLLHSIDSDNFAQTLNILINKTNDTIGEAELLSGKIGDFITLVNKLPDSQIRDVLVNVIQQTGTNVKDVTTQVSKWFDGEMERLSELYKKRSQLILFLTGLLVAGVLNVNTIDIADALAKNPSLREAVLEQSKSIVGTSDTDKLSLNDALSKLNELSLPIGWNSDCPIIGDSNKVVDPLCPPSAGNIIITLLGILITGASVALGAPFWFDLLKALTSRAGGSKTETETK